MKNLEQGSMLTKERISLDSITVTDKIGLGFGAISAPEMTDEQAEDWALEVADFRVGIDSHNPATCVDGRCRCRDGSSVELPLGAHIAGGAETLLVAAKSVGYYLEGEALLSEAEKLGFTLGAHCDSTNRDDGFTAGTGCGANDKAETICALFTEHQSTLMGVQAMLMGESFEEDLYRDVVIKPLSDDCNYLRNLVGDSKVETLEDDGVGVHGHRESMVIFNYRDNTTIDRDEYYDVTGKQVFVVDVWYIKKLSDALAVSSGIVAQAAQLYHAMMAFQLATYVGLADGSQRAVVMN